MSNDGHTVHLVGSVDDSFSVRQAQLNINRELQNEM